ncbi:unnamed protein product [Lathyrus oleraceus]|nr:F-box/kelch-repeat protein At3g23880-like [Pisum sativum]XP_050881033.1 F-box/kelch-repeat protein At3g23880-like [Pisum sativum]
MRSPKVMRTNPNMSSFDVSLPTLPFDLISEIVSRLPVKSLLQFRCVSKSWKSLISDPIFARKHLNLSTTRRLLCLSYDKHSHRFFLNSYSLQSIFRDTDYNITRLEYPSDNICKGSLSHYAVGSCDGILCVATCRFFLDFKPLVVLWNPSIRKFKELPPFENPPGLDRLYMSYGFGYDHASHDYKVVVIYNLLGINGGIVWDTTKAKVYTLSTDSWRTIQPFPFDSVSSYQQGRYVSGSINWLAYSKGTHQRCIISFDLGHETYQMIRMPLGLERTPKDPVFSVLRDWLCLIFDHDVWVMKEYGVKESWTKLFNVTHLLDPPFKSFVLTNVLYIFQDDQLLLLFRKDCERRFILYNFKNDTSKVSFMLKDFPQLCVESLISPCS